MRHPRFFSFQRMLLFMLLAIITIASLCGHEVLQSAQRRFIYPVRYGEVIERASAQYGVDPYLVCAMIKAESAWDEHASSGAGARGLMQVMPQTADHLASQDAKLKKTYPPHNLEDPTTNIEYGVRYLAFLQSQFSSRDEVIAAYNAGPGAVASWKKDASDEPFANVIQYGETKSYVAYVNRTYDSYKELYPNGISK